MPRNRPDKDGTHRLAFERNKKKIYATQTVQHLRSVLFYAKISTSVITLY